MISSPLALHTYHNVVTHSTGTSLLSFPFQYANITYRFSFPLLVWSGNAFFFFFCTQLLNTLKKSNWIFNLIISSTKLLLYRCESFFTQQEICKKSAGRKREKEGEREKERGYRGKKVIRFSFLINEKLKEEL